MISLQIKQKKKIEMREEKKKHTERHLKIITCAGAHICISGQTFKQLTIITD